MTDLSRPHRMAWLDHTRAAGIVLVVVGHAIISVERSGMVLVPEYAAAERAIYSFHMPLFFMLAGITHGLGGRRPPAEALRSLAWTVLVPYLVWSAVWFGMKTAFAAEANLPVEGSLLSILWRPVDHFWFLHVLLLVKLLWILVDATGSAVVRRMAITLPLAVAFLGGHLVEAFASPYLIYWAAFFGVGVAAGAIGSLPRHLLIPAAIVAEVVWVGLVAAIPDLSVGMYDGLRTTAALAGSLSLIGAMSLAALRGWPGRVAGFVGEASLTIFLTHTLFGAATRVALSKAGLLTPETLIAGATVAGLVGPLVLHAAVLRAGLALDLPIARWIGFGRIRRSAYVDLAPRGPAAAVSLGGPAA